MDKKVSLFLSDEIWKEVLEHANEKQIDRSMLIQLCKPEPRLRLLKTILEKRYVIDRPHIKKIPKPGKNEMREVYVNQKLDRIVLTLINEIYNKIYGNQIHKSCVSYKKGIGCGKIVKNLSKQMNQMKFSDGDFMGYKFDLRKYFDSVSKELLNEALSELSTNSPIDKLVYDYYNDDYIYDSKDNLVEHYKSIAQGCAVSAFLANYILRDIDSIMSSMDIIYYRYSDDIIMLGKDAKKAKLILEWLLEEKGLSINEKKTETLFYGKPFSFLGFELNKEQISLSAEKEAVFKKQVKRICKFRKGMKRRDMKNVKKGVNKINNWLYLAYEKNPSDFGWAMFYFGVLNNEEQIHELDCYIKDHLRYLYNKSWSNKTNNQYVSNDTLRNLGYISMVQLFKNYKFSKELYQLDVACM